MDVPPPTWCPECRMIRRMAFWNERNFFKRIDEGGKAILSTYPQESPHKVIDRDFWWSDKFDAASYGRDYDFSRPFFEQFGELLLSVPLPSRLTVGLVNSDYSNASDYIKNCYMCFNASTSEDCFYGVFFTDSRDSVDVLDSDWLESSWEIYSGGNCYRVFYGARVSDCRDSYFLYNCSNVSDCFGCVNLRHKQYHIFNEPYSREDYFRKLKEMNLGSHASFERWRKEFREFVLKFPHKYINGLSNVNVSGDDINQAKDVKESYEIYEAENIAYCQSVGQHTKDSYDFTNWGRASQLVYESVDCGSSSRGLKFCSGCFSGCRDLEYSISCFSSENCFGCVGLKKKKYCIFNKQYSKEEYEKLRAKIVEHMNVMPYVDKLGRIYKYGEFFPLAMAPFAANETAIMDFTDMTMEKALRYGLAWRESKTSEYKITILSKDLPDHIKDVAESVTKEAIGCTNCKQAYRIIPKELEFYKRFQIPLPRLCHNCRFKERIKQRNFPKLFSRNCQCAGAMSENGIYKNTVEHIHGVSICPNQFKTAYSPDKPEIIYCEKCYQQEVV